MEELAAVRLEENGLSSQPRAGISMRDQDSLDGFTETDVTGLDERIPLGAYKLRNDHRMWTS